MPLHQVCIGDVGNFNVFSLVIWKTHAMKHWKHDRAQPFRCYLSSKHLVGFIERHEVSVHALRAAQRPLTAAMDSACPDDQAVPTRDELEGTVTGGFWSKKVWTPKVENYLSRVCRKFATSFATSNFASRENPAFQHTFEFETKFKTSLHVSSPLIARSLIEAVLGL